MHINVVISTVTFFTGRKNEKKSTRTRDGLFKELDLTISGEDRLYGNLTST